jgi:hypothetical protein
MSKKVINSLHVSISVFSGTDPMIRIRAKTSRIRNTGKKRAVIYDQKRHLYISPDFARHNVPLQLFNEKSWVDCVRNVAKIKKVY